MANNFEKMMICGGEAEEVSVGEGSHPGGVGGTKSAGRAADVLA